jgi:hypothetical protein
LLPDKKSVQNVHPERLKDRELGALRLEHSKADSNSIYPAQPHLENSCKNIRALVKRFFSFVNKAVSVLRIRIPKFCAGSGSVSALFGSATQFEV